MIRVAVDFSAKMDNDREFCQATGGHEPHDKNPDLCRKCGALEAHSRGLACLLTADSLGPGPDTKKPGTEEAREDMRLSCGYSWYQLRY